MEEWYNRKCMEQKTFDLKVFDFEWNNKNSKIFIL